MSTHQHGIRMHPLSAQPPPPREAKMNRTPWLGLQCTGVPVSSKPCNVRSTAVKPCTRGTPPANPSVRHSDRPTVMAPSHAALCCDCIHTAGILLAYLCRTPNLHRGTGCLLSPWTKMGIHPLVDTTKNVKGLTGFSACSRYSCHRRLPRGFLSGAVQLKEGFHGTRTLRNRRDLTGRG